MGQPLTSVIIPAYNCARYIEKAVESVLYQDVLAEIIVIDDGSTDNLEQVLDKYISTNRLRYIRNERNIGVSASRNRGVQEANGEYIAYLDADDWWKPNKLIKQLELIQNKKCALCYTGRELVNDDGTSTGKTIHIDQEINYQKLLLHNTIACSSVVMKKTIAREHPMSNDEVHEDYLTWLKILNSYGKAYGIDEPLLVYRMSSNGKSRNKVKSAKMTYGVYRQLNINKLTAILYTSSHLMHGIMKYK